MANSYVLKLTQGCAISNKVLRPKQLVKVGEQTAKMLLKQNRAVLAADGDEGDVMDFTTPPAKAAEQTPTQDPNGSE